MKRYLLSAIALLLTLPIPTSAFANIPKNATIEGCDGSSCVMAVFNGTKWEVKRIADARSDRTPTVTYDGFKPESIQVCTGAKCLSAEVNANGDVKTLVTEDEREYKAPSASAIAK